MPAVSPKIGDVLMRTTGATDIDSALHRVFSDYVELKLRSLDEAIGRFEKKWGMKFNTFRKKARSGALADQMYSYEAESDFWQWEEAETLRKHYRVLKQDWI
jgi:hypothetical protein